MEMERIFELQADVCKIFANATRLEIISLLEEKEMSTSELMRITGLNKVNISQHMNVLRSKGVVITRREGVLIYYRIASPKIIQACHLMREVLMEQLREKGRVASDLAGDGRSGLRKGILPGKGKGKIIKGHQRSIS